MGGVRPEAENRSDEDLMAAFVGGEAPALGLLASRYERAMLGYATGMLRDEGLARDCVQETWVRVIRHAGTFKGKSSVKTWLYRILIHRCRDAVRGARRRGVVGVDGEIGRANLEDCDEVLTRDLSARVNAALDQLEPGRREVVLLCHHRGMSHREAAAALGVAMGTVKTRLYAAMDELRAMVGAGSGVRESSDG